jgi:multiple sugar transport system ATP-binding protein
VRRTGADAAVELPGGIALPAATGAAAGASVRVGIRPEHLDLAARGDGLPATVKVVEPTGAETLVLVDIGGTEATAVFTERHAFTPGAAIALAPKAGLLHVFDAASGKRV